MKHNLVLTTLISFALLALIPVSAGAVELTLNSILVAQQSGATADGIINTVRNPANTMGMTADDMPMLRSADVPENVISVIMAYMPPMQAPAAAPLQPDDARLLDVVRLVESGMSESNLAERVKYSGEVYNLSVNDLLYLKQNRVAESTITALMGTRGAAPVAAAPVAAAPATPVATPSEVVFENLVLANRGFWRRDNKGQLTLRGDTLEWADANNRDNNFTFQVAGLEKVWYTCEARASGNFCYQLNFKIVHGDRYKFQDAGREKGSNAAVENLMETLRVNFPRLTIDTPSVGD